MHVLATNLCVWLRVLVEETYHGASHSSEGHSGQPGSGPPIPGQPGQQLLTVAERVPFAAPSDRKGSLYQSIILNRPTFTLS